MKDILFITHFAQLPYEQGNDRFLFLAQKLCSTNRVELLTSSFDHKRKKQREIRYESNCDLKYNVFFEPGYLKNVSLKRFYSHYIGSKNLKKYLRNRQKPDLIYCSIPSFDVAYEAAKYARKNNIQFILDVQDLWPEAFQMVFNIPILADLLFFPMRLKADYAYKQADSLIAVSETYLERGLRVNNKSKDNKVVFLGTSLETFDLNVQKNKIIKPDDEIWLAYCGTLGNSYDLTSAIDAVAILGNMVNEKVKFIIMGDGPRREEFERRALEKKIFCKFTGNLPYEKMCGILSACDININPIMHGAAQSIINKHADYAASGHPVVSTQESEEYRKLIVDYDMGFNCNNSDAVDLAEKIMILINSKKIRLQKGKNARKCAEECFDRAYTYKKIVDMI